MTSASSARDVAACRTIQPPASRKKPESRKLALMIIIPSRSASVGRSIAANARSSGIAPAATSATAPASAIVARFIRSHG